MSVRVSSHDTSAAHQAKTAEPVVLTPEFIAQADALISHYPASKRSASLPLLHLWQETFGHISPQGIDWIANKLELQPINILEIVTFYPMLRQQAAGRQQIKVCRTLSCALQGAYELCHHLKQRCGATEESGHGVCISADGKYSIEFVECLASCHTAPVMMVNEDLHESVTITGADKILSTY